MLRYFIIAALFPVVFSALSTFLDEVTFNEVFAPGEGQCDHISSTNEGSGCMDCFLCNYSAIVYEYKRKFPQVYKYTLKNAACNFTTEVCCMNQRAFFPRSVAGCGKVNPRGVPRQLRPTLKTVLPGEYPWRAWIYRKATDKELCAATYIYTSPLALITPLSCLQNYLENDVYVIFDRRTRRPASVASIHKHENYNSGEKENDIALVTLRSNETMPRWAVPACTPANRLLHASSCTTVSDDDKGVSPLIIKQSDYANKTSNSVFYAVLPPGDYKPQFGAGLYYLDKTPSVPAHAVHGIALSTDEESGVSTYTNVTHFIPWIEEKLGVKFTE